MNRIQFWIATGLSGVIVALLIAHIFLQRQTNIYQYTLNQAQQVINQGQGSQSMSKQLAMRIVQDSQKNGGDQALKDLMTRQQITFNPATNSADTTAAPSPAPDTTSSPAVPPATH